MKIVIDMPEEMYKDIKSGKDGYSNYVHTAIRNGTPLSTDAVDRVTIKEHMDSFGKDTNVTTTDCISREAVIKTISEWLFSKEFHYTNAAEYLRKRLDELPSVSAQPKMGKWLIKRIKYYDHAVCSVCGEDSYLSPEWDALELYKYCPNCGSDMRGVEE